MDTNNNEELIEELTDSETSKTEEDGVSKEIVPDKKIEDEIGVDVIQKPINAEENISNSIVENPDEVTVKDENSIQTESSDLSLNKENKDGDKIENNEESSIEKQKKSKVPLIIFLSILLIIDIAALVIYLIGIEKVLVFIK